MKDGVVEAGLFSAEARSAKCRAAYRRAKRLEPRSSRVHGLPGSAVMVGGDLGGVAVVSAAILGGRPRWSRRPVCARVPRL